MSLSKKAFDLYIEGFSVDYISKKVDKNYSQTLDLIHQGRALYAQEIPSTLEDQKLDQLSILNSLVARCYTDLNQASDVLSDDGKLYRDGIKTRNQITQTLLKLLQEKAKLLGLHAPIEISQKTQGEQLSLPDLEKLELSELEDIYAEMVR